MQLFGFDWSIRRKAAALQTAPAGASALSSGWRPWIVHEPYTGAWQRNDEIALADVLSHPYVFGCIRQIVQDVGKLTLRLMRLTDGIWTETTNPAYSPVLRTPNHYQGFDKLVEQWLISKLTAGNTYVLKSRDRRGVVDGLYVLNPSRVTVLLTPAGDVYYELATDDLHGLPADLPRAARIAPASEIIHDRYLCLYSPLVGIGPLYAAQLAAKQGLEIQTNSTTFFANGAKPSGIILVPGKIDDTIAAEIKTHWDANYSVANIGKTGVLSDGMTYVPLSMSAADSQLTDQQKTIAESICAAFGVPISMLDASRAPASYSSAEPQVQHYYAQCLQALMTALERCLDRGLELPADLGTEFDPDDLIWLDTATRTKAAADAIGSGALSPNEARRKYYGVGPVDGGDSPMVQQQYYSLAALAERDQDQPFSKPSPATPARAPDAAPDDEPPADDETGMAGIDPARFRLALETHTADLHV